MISQDTRALTNEERAHQWAMKVIERHARRMGASMEYRDYKGKSVLILGYPEQEGLQVKEIGVHNPIWFANQLIQAEKGLEKARDGRQAGGTETPP